jgi:hypothetical protein
MGFIAVQAILPTGGEFRKRETGFDSGSLGLHLVRFIVGVDLFC